MKNRGALIYAVWSAFLLVLTNVLIIGWVLNVVTLYKMPPEFTGHFVVRAIGVFVAPLGAILGWL